MKMADLKAKCKELGLPGTGKTTSDDLSTSVLCIAHHMRCPCDQVDKAFSIAVVLVNAHIPLSRFTQHACTLNAGVKADLVARIKAHFAGTGDGDTEAEGTAPPAADEIVEEEAAEVDEDAVIEEVTAQPVRTAPAGKYQPIVFSEDIARKMEAQKIEVAHVAAGAAIQPSAEDKLKARAERFVDPAVAKLKERAQRFNLSHPEVEKEKLLQRALKFGSLHPVVEEEKRKKRAERFNIVSEEQKKKMR